jgi:hypothetical protein
MVQFTFLKEGVYEQKKGLDGKKAKRQKKK